MWLCRHNVAFSSPPFFNSELLFTHRSKLSQKLGRCVENYSPRFCLPPSSAPSLYSHVFRKASFPKCPLETWTGIFFFTKHSKDAFYFCSFFYGFLCGFPLSEMVWIVDGIIDSKVGTRRLSQLAADRVLLHIRDSRKK